MFYLSNTLLVVFDSLSLELIEAATFSAMGKQHYLSSKMRSRDVALDPCMTVLRKATGNEITRKK